MNIIEFNSNSAGNSTRFVTLAELERGLATRPCWMFHRYHKTVA